MLLCLHHNIVYIDVGISAKLLEEALLHATLKSGTGISQAECHGQVAEGSEWCDEGGLQPIGRVQLDLVVAGIGIKEGQQLTSVCGVNHLIYPRQSKRIFGAGFVEAGVINAHAPLVVLLQYKDWVGKPLWKKHFHNEASC